MKKIVESIRKNYLLVVFVYGAFTAMVILSIYFVNAINTARMQDYGQQLMNSAELRIQQMLADNEMVLQSAYIDILEMVRDEAPTPERLLNQLKGSFYRMVSANPRFTYTRNIYGEIYGNWFDTKGTFVPSPDYNQTTRPWHVAAVRAKGETAYSESYLDADTGGYVVSVSRQVLNDKGAPVGVLSTDVYISHIADYVNSIKVTNNGFGVLLNANLDIVTTKKQNLVGHNLLMPSITITPSLNELGRTILDKGDVTMEYTDAEGVPHVAFFRQLFNGWYVGGICPLYSYNKQLYKMALALTALGVLLATALSALLIRFSVQRDQSAEVSQLKSSFLANMSHEIRTPMHAIMGMSEIALHGDLPSGVRTIVERIRSSSQHLLYIVNDILDFSKIESGKLEIMPVRYQLSSLISDVATATQLRIGEKPVQFAVDMDPQIPFELMGDEVRIRQILDNLLNNAIKFTPSGSVSLTVSMSSAPHNGKLALRFVVRDTGIGIRADDIVKLFSSFTQVDTTRNRSEEGTGLGLAICKSLSELMGGRIWLESKYGRGSAFYVDIPQDIVDATPTGGFVFPAPHNRSGDLERITFTAPQARLLVVDDNAVNLEVVKGLLAPCAAAIDTALSARQCFTLLKRHRYDIIFMDHMMPGMDGMETTKRIRAMEGEYFATVPIIALTANAILGVREMYLASGFNEFLAKPIEMKKLVRALRHFLPQELILNVPPQTPEAQPQGHENASPRITYGYANNALTENVLRAIRTEGLRKVPLLRQLYAQKDLTLYTIEVHALKSVARTAGMDELGDLAAAHEEAARQERISVIEETFDRLITLYEGFVAELAWVDAPQSFGGGTELTAEEKSRLLEVVALSANNFDIDGVNEALAQLREANLNDDERERVFRLLEMAESLDFDGLCEETR